MEVGSDGVAVRLHYSLANVLTMHHFLPLSGEVRFEDAPHGSSSSPASPDVGCHFTNYTVVGLGCLIKLLKVVKIDRRTIETDTIDRRTIETESQTLRDNSANWGIHPYHGNWLETWNFWRLPSS